MALGGGPEMPFLDHLEELRWRLFRAAAALLVGMIIGLFLVLKMGLIGVLSQAAAPYLPDGKLIVTHPTHTLSIVMMLALAIGLVIASPVVLYQAWAFVSPALFPKERRLGMAVLAGGLVLFCLGVALAYFLVLPASIPFLVAIGGDSLATFYTAQEYFSFVVTLCLTFGIAFELPIVILALSALGLVTPMFLRQYRRHAFVLCAVGSALVTPGDLLIATLALVVPLYLLYELGILLAVVTYRWRTRRDASAESAGDDIGVPA
jgi:sec-independent protein translocase protein TatC